MKITRIFLEFFESEKASGIILVACTAISLMLANLPTGDAYLDFWNISFAGHNLVHWINDGLMTIFFLLIGLELERELYNGELSNLKKALFPVVAAIGGMLVPAGLHLLFNFGTITQSGAGIPMATDIAFAIGILSLLGKRVPISLKVFLTALAVIDDLGAIFTIAIFYSGGISLFNLGIAMSVFAVLLVLNRLKVHTLVPYIIGGVIMWYFMLNSGVHATITGVLLAFAIPFVNGDERSPSIWLQHRLHVVVAFIIMPIFALANTAIVIESDWSESLMSPNSIGIFTGLVFGKPVGILLFCYLAVLIDMCALPQGLTWKHIVGVGFLGGIGFTMSIFITLLAFDDGDIISASKITIILSSIVAAVVGLVWLKLSLKRQTFLNL